jgi:hypothetical protein
MGGSKVRVWVLHRAPSAAADMGSRSVGHAFAPASELAPSGSLGHFSIGRLAWPEPSLVGALQGSNTTQSRHQPGKCRHRVTLSPVKSERAASMMAIRHRPRSARDIFPHR